MIKRYINTGYGKVSNLSTHHPQREKIPYVCPPLSIPLSNTVDVPLVMRTEIQLRPVLSAGLIFLSLW